MSDSQDSGSERGWLSWVGWSICFFAMYVLALGPLEWIFTHFDWKDSLVARIFPIVYWPVVKLADLTGTLDWLALYVTWWSELA